MKRLYGASLKTELYRGKPEMRDSKIAARAAIDFRDELFGRNWPDDTGIGQFAALPASEDVRDYAARARAAGILLGMWCAPRRAFVYPEFQFDPVGKLRPDVAELLAILPNDDDRGGWRRTFWLYSPHAYLDGQSPAEVFGSDPARVLDAARDEFAGDHDAHW
ncbi:hypothetical protein DR64_1317 [Paraburkholderia xenovorans LB400]|uniref:Antitoxin Xre/MbcA/ParS-like toxin-binding domain-containing protein n=1 Tax=Paraburkholderia xenovorans (strain LB400) TaxID=266265 RepID=Q143X2_PARXL|nr:hypothetical protein [Paraburkholderia xenovorans]ABE29367.1 hypothetical protein Bxe_A3622 [Paraburkholderia xenovorans LB400]AIP32210.1 hypothetical protein DR64_1317 [Paraburkholderia xenovorans LB400]